MTYDQPHEQKNINLSWGSSITDDKKWWYILEYNHKQNDTTVDGYGAGLTKDDVFKIKLRRFFF